MALDAWDAIGMQMKKDSAKVRNATNSKKVVKRSRLAHLHGYYEHFGYREKETKGTGAERASNTAEAISEQKIMLKTSDQLEKQQKHVVLV